ncbi:hypothetical protein B0H17DRAFT_1204268 [Mycena rosella]|uniref:Uncharacterized protein n=1 Tax=Mycena rosella TaxID=1033263 RepID=A0AAD7D9R3_MYCRO|nr:hypothetical protein B0H17DRAFT_1204268 [Mycena rosella]
MSVNAPANAPTPALSPTSAAPTTVTTLNEPTKRKYSSLLESLGQPRPATGPKKRRKGATAKLVVYLPVSSPYKYLYSTDTATLDRLTSAAKYFVRAVSPYRDIGTAMVFGPEHHWGQHADPDPSNVITIPVSELADQQEYIKAFDKMFSTVPDLLDVVKQMYLDIEAKGADQWDKLVDKMQKAATSARTADTGGLKHHLAYVLPNPASDVIYPPVPKQESKSDRGVAHPMLRYFFLPWSDRVKLPPLVLPKPSTTQSTTTEAPASNQFADLLVAGCVELKATEYPAFFWAEDTYDEDDLDKGLLRGPLILRVLRHVWTAPSSALFGLDNGIPRSCNARLHNVFTVDKEMIGYAGVQARIMLSTTEWKPRDGSYNYEDLFKSILNLFEDPEDPWAWETLAWYQQMVFGDAVDDAETDVAPVANASVNVFIAPDSLQQLSHTTTNKALSSRTLIDPLAHESNAHTLINQVPRLPVSTNRMLFSPSLIYASLPTVLPLLHSLAASTLYYCFAMMCS